MHLPRVYARSAQLQQPDRREKGEFRVKLECEDLKKTDDFFLGANGEWEPCYDEMKYSSELAVRVGEQILMGGVGKGEDRTEPDGSKTKLSSETYFTVELAELTKWQAIEKQDGELKKVIEAING